MRSIAAAGVLTLFVLLLFNQAPGADGATTYGLVHTPADLIEIPQYNITFEHLIECDYYGSDLVNITLEYRQTDINFTSVLMGPEPYVSPNRYGAKIPLELNTSSLQYRIVVVSANGTTTYPRSGLYIVPLNDSHLPTVEYFDPTRGFSLGGLMPLRIRATDNVGVKNVTIYYKMPGRPTWKEAYLHPVPGYNDTVWGVDMLPWYEVGTMLVKFNVSDGTRVLSWPEDEYAEFYIVDDIAPRIVVNNMGQYMITVNSTLGDDVYEGKTFIGHYINIMMWLWDNDNITGATFYYGSNDGDHYMDNAIPCELVRYDHVNNYTTFSIYKVTIPPIATPMDMRFAVNISDENGNYDLIDQYFFVFPIEDGLPPVIKELKGDSDFVQRTGTVKVLIEDQSPLTAVVLRYYTEDNPQTLQITMQKGDDGWYTCRIPKDLIDSGFKYQIRASDGKLTTDYPEYEYVNVDTGQKAVSSWVLWFILILIGIPAILLVILPAGRL